MLDTFGSAATPAGRTTLSIVFWRALAGSCCVSELFLPDRRHGCPQLIDAATSEHGMVPRVLGPVELHHLLGKNKNPSGIFEGVCVRGAGRGRAGRKGVLSSQCLA